MAHVIYHLSRGDVILLAVWIVQYLLHQLMVKFPDGEKCCNSSASLSSTTIPENHLMLAQSKLNPANSIPRALAHLWESKALSQSFVEEGR